MTLIDFPATSSHREGRVAGEPRDVEGLDDGHFVLGVQWHAETLTAEAEQLALFERLVAAAELASRKSADAQEEEDSGAHAV